jgi:phage baseplate assembly protein W
MATDYGLDLACTDDLTNDMAEVTGLANVAQALYRRIITTRGALIDDPAYGFAISNLVDDSQTARQAAVIASSIDAEFEKDERVLSSTTEGRFERDKGAAWRYIAASVVTTADGPFQLVLAVSQVTVEILQIPR